MHCDVNVRGVWCAKHRSARAEMGYKLQPELCETELCLDSAWAEPGCVINCRQCVPMLVLVVRNRVVLELGCVINCRQPECLPATHASCLADLFSGKTLSALHSLDDHPHSSRLFSSKY